MVATHASSECPRPRKRRLGSIMTVAERWGETNNMTAALETTEKKGLTGLSLLVR